MLTRNEKGSAQAHKTRSNTCRHAHKRLPCCLKLTQHQHHGRPLNHPNSTNMQCDSPTRYLASALPCCPTPLPSTSQHNPKRRNSLSRAHERTANAVLAQIQLGQPVQIAHWIERACDCPTPHKYTNKTQPITTNAHKHVLFSSSRAHIKQRGQCTGTRHAIRHMSSCTQQAAALPNTDPTSTPRPSPQPFKQHKHAM
jgi:hypothetical protein